jgi:hypothetical protein
MSPACWHDSDAWVAFHSWQIRLTNESRSLTSESPTSGEPLEITIDAGKGGILPEVSDRPHP